MKKVLVLVICIFSLTQITFAKTDDILVVGVDARSASVYTGNTDVLMLVSVENNDIKLVSFYRDFYVNVNDSWMKINAVLTKYGINELLNTINKYFDLDIQKYVIVNWNGVSKAIDTLGTLEVDISDKEFEYMNAFIYETANALGKNPENYFIDKAGRNYLNGIQAVSYSRLRLMDSDYNRTERQKLIIKKCVEKSKHIEVSKLLGVYSTILQATKHNLDLLFIAKYILKAKSLNISTTLGYPDKFDIISVNYNLIPKSLIRTVCFLHEYLYNKKLYKPTQVVEELEKKYKEVR